MLEILGMKWTWDMVEVDRNVNKFMSKILKERNPLEDMHAGVTIKCSSKN
jgi:hypothetical protein